MAYDVRAEGFSIGDDGDLHPSAPIHHHRPPPTMTDFRALCAELAEQLDGATDPCDLSIHAARMAAQIRAALDEPEGEGPTPIDYRRWHDAHSEECNTWSEQLTPPLNLRTTVEALAWAKHCLARWGRHAPAPKPIPVSERLPEDGDCVVITAYDGTSAIDEHYCYLAKIFRHCGQVQLLWDLKPTYCLKMDLPFTHWLPASTQFLPTTVDSDQPT